MESTKEGWDRTPEVSLNGAYLCCREVAPIMLKQEKGKIIDISDIVFASEPFFYVVI